MMGWPSADPLKGKDMKMDSGIATTMVLYAAIFFLCGWGWGQWWNERQIRKEQRELVKGRMTVSMPVKPEDAAATMKLLAALVEEAERTRKAEAHAQ
jgi:hypothetical protein